MKFNSLGKNALLNGIKECCAIIFPFISFAYCSNILGTEVVGKYSFSQSIVAYFVLLATLGIPNYAIREGAPIRDNPNKLNKFVNEVFTINLITTVAAYIILIFLTLSVKKFMDYKYIIAIISIQIVLTTLGADWINSIFEDYFYLAIRYIIIQILSIICMLVFVRNPDDIYIYTFISMMSNAGGNILNWFYLKKHGISPRPTHSVNIRTHIVPIFILFCSNFAAIIYLNSDITMLGFFCTDNDVGLYSISSKIYSMVKSVINAVIMVTVPRFSRYIAQNDLEKYRNELSYSANAIILLIAPIIIGMFMEADKILSIFVDNGILAGKTVIQILSFALFFAVGACFFSYSILIPNHAEKYFLRSTIAAAFINIVLNFIFIPLFGMIGAAITTLIAEIIVFIMALLHSLEFTCIKINKKSLFSVILSSAAVLEICLCVDSLFDNKILALIISITFSFIGYFSLLIIFKNPIIIELLKNIISKIKNNNF